MANSALGRRLGFAALAAAIAVVAGGTLYLLLHDAAWLLGDQTDFFIHTTARGRYMPASLNIGRGGRFLPLQMFEFNILPLLGFRSPLAHHMVVAAEYIATLALMLLLFLQISKKENKPFDPLAAMFAAAFFCTSTGAIITFGDLIFAERAIVLALFAFLLCSGGGNPAYIRRRSRRVRDILQRTRVHNILDMGRDTPFIFKKA